MITLSRVPQHTARWAHCFNSTNNSIIKNVNTIVNTKSYIIVGAGSAGCVMASRLSENSQNHVTLIESGKSYTSSPFWWRIKMPSAMAFNLQDKKYNWDYSSTPQQALNNRKISQPRGKTMGGSGSINAMVWVRGNRRDYAKWQDEGNAQGWGYDKVLPYFKKSEKYSEVQWRRDTGILSLKPYEKYHSSYGKIQVQKGNSDRNPLFQAFIRAGESLGYKYNGDMNGEDQEGLGPLDMNIKSDGSRCSSYEAYIKPYQNTRSNLQIKSNVNVTKILFDLETTKTKTKLKTKQEPKSEPNIEPNIEPKANGVHITYNNWIDGEDEKIYADEIILCAGTIGSPQLLQLSGIGPKHILDKCSIPIIKELKGVGENLQDHIEIYLQYKCKVKGLSLYRYQFPYIHNMVKIGLEWFLTGKGKCAQNHMDVGGFIKSDPLQEYPNVKFHFLPASLSNISSDGIHIKRKEEYQVNIGTLRETSRGTSHINDNIPTSYPDIDPKYLTDKDGIDMDEFVDCIKRGREIMNAQGFDEFNGGEVFPGPNIISDDDIKQFIRERAESAYHLCGTCKMTSSLEKDDLMGVCDEEGKVKGVQGLRVVDASLMPYITSGNLNAVVIMMAEKISDDIQKNNVVDHLMSK
jgi:choline dehydrogenase